MTMIKYFRDDDIPITKVYILQWGATGSIGGVYASEFEAKRIADKTNKKKNWKHKFSEVITGRLCEWVVNTYELK